MKFHICILGYLSEVIIIDTNCNTTFQNFLNKDCKNNEKSYAPCDTEKGWLDVDFKSAEYRVQKLQSRIAKAWTNGDTKKVDILQHQLIHSTSAKILAVRTVTSNKGKYTPGIDNIIWIAPEEKFNAALSLTRRGYRPRPLRRINIPKINGGIRPLSIPTMKDRAMQTLYKFELEPISEQWADKNSYGFRPNLSTRDALIRVYHILNNSRDYIWVMKTDVKSCFDNLSHEWIMDNIPIDKKVLWKFLKCGYVDNHKFHMTNRGVPQGGSISPIICNMALDGLEDKLIESIGAVKFIRYADDLLVISPYKDKLIQAIDIINEFLSRRGLYLSTDKTCITRVDEGFNFLGWFIKMDSIYPFIIPNRDNLESFVHKIKDVLHQDKVDISLSNKLQAIIVGWTNYHAGVIDNNSFNILNYNLCSYIWEITNDSNIVETCSKFYSSL